MKNKVCVFIANFDTYQIRTDKIINLKSDRRTKEGKLKQEFYNCLMKMDRIAWELEIDLCDVVPYRP